MKKIVGWLVCIVVLFCCVLAPATAFAAANTQGTGGCFAKTVRVTGVSLSKTSLTLTVSKTYKLTATVKPGNASNKKVTWKSGDKTIATVSSTGNVKGIKAGSTYIYVYTVDGNKSAKCKVTVKEPVNTYGNTGGNIENGGFAAKQGDWIYYANINNGGYLYKIRTDGTGKQKLSSDKGVSYINVVGDWVYYCANRGSTIYKIRTNGKNRTRLKGGTDFVYNDDVTVVDGYIYYSNVIDNDADDYDTVFYKMRTDGSIKYKYKTATPCLNFNVVGGWIYYSYEESDGLYKMRMDGSGNTRLCNVDGVFSINVVGGWLYYMSYSAYEGDNAVYKVRTDGTGLTTLMSGGAQALNVAGGWIYYSDLYALYKMKTDGSGKTLLCSDDEVVGINVVDNWIYYEIWNDDYTYSLHKIKTDGTGRQKVN